VTPSRSVMQESLPAGIVELIRHPKRLGARSLWKALPQHERREVVVSAIRAPGSNARERVVQYLSRVKKFRPQTIRGWHSEKVVDAFVALKTIENQIANFLLKKSWRTGEVLTSLSELDEVDEAEFAKRMYRVEGKYGRLRVTIAILVGRFGRYPAIDRPWKWLGESVEPGDEPSKTQVSGSDAVRAPSRTSSAFRPEGVPVQFGNQLAPSSQVSPASASAGEIEPDSAGVDEDVAVPEIGSEAGNDEPGGQPVDEPGQEVSDEGATGGSVDGEDRRNTDSFTQIDRLIRRAIVDCRQEVEGALTEDELNDAVSELANLNGSM